MNCVDITRPLNNYQKYLQIIIKASVVEFIFCKTPFFQHIPMNTFRQMWLKHENHSLRGILFQTTKIIIIITLFQVDEIKIQNVIQVTYTG